MSDWKAQLLLLRRYHGLKQAVLAEMLNVDQGTVSRWERGVSEPDLSRRKRLRDLMWTFGTRLECDVRRLMASPMGGKIICSTKNIILDLSLPPDEAALVDKSNIIGQDSRKIRKDSAYNELWDSHLSEIVSGNFAGIHSIYFSSITNKWTESYTVPVIIGGGLHLFGERRRLDPTDGLTSSLRVIGLQT